MKTKAKIRSLVVAVALASTGAAQAAIDSDNALSPTLGTGAGELFLSVIDRGGAAPRSYVLDLGITAADFLANDASYLNNISLAADANLMNLLTNQTGTIAWNLAAAQNMYGPTFDDLGYLSTAPSAPIANLNTVQGETGLTNSLGQLGQYLQSANAPLVPNATNYAIDTSVLFNSPLDNAFYDGPFWGDTWHGATHSTEGALDDSLAFYFVGMNYSNDGDGSSSRVQTMLGNWTLSSAGLLTYTGGVAPIPVPAAVWLLGSALIGMVGVARRRTEQV